jgi:hypothetical protein
MTKSRIFSNPGVLLAQALLAGIAACSSSPSTNGNLRWYTTCGAPVCPAGDDGGTPADAGASQDGGVAACTTEKAGDSCASAGTTCDPGLGCDVLLRCADKDPKVQPGGCPISRRAAKRDVTYLDEQGKLRLAQEVKRIRLAWYRYKEAPEREHLGFMIDDAPDSPAVDGRRDQIDLYGYVSMLVAALQQESARADAQERELASLRQRLDALMDRKRAGPGHRPK